MEKQPRPKILVVEDEPALILTDLVMPEMGGKALLHALAERGWPGLLIVLSGHPLGSREEEGIDAERVAAVLTKPVRGALREDSRSLHPPPGAIGGCHHAQSENLGC